MTMSSLGDKAAGSSCELTKSFMFPVRSTTITLIPSIQGCQVQQPEQAEALNPKS